MGFAGWAVHFAVSLQSAGNWWRMGGRSNPQTQTQTALSQLLECGQEAALTKNALLRAMRAPGELGYGLSACGVALGLESMSGVTALPLTLTKRVEYSLKEYLTNIHLTNRLQLFV